MMLLLELQSSTVSLKPLLMFQHPHSNMPMKKMNGNDIIHLMLLQSINLKSCGCCFMSEIVNINVGEKHFFTAFLKYVQSVVLY